MVDYDEYLQKYRVCCGNLKCKIQPTTDFHAYIGVITKDWNRRAEDGK